MTEFEKQRWADILLEYRLGHASPEEAADIERQRAQRPDLAAMDRKLAGLLDLLGTWPDPAMPADLPARTCRYVAEHSPYRADRWRQPAGTEPWSGGLFRFLSLRDVVAAAACIVFLMALTVPTYNYARTEMLRVRCLSNLRQAHQATMAYGLTYTGALPFAGRPADAAWLPGCGQRQYLPNTTHLVLLITGRYVSDVRVLKCPDEECARGTLPVTSRVPPGLYNYQNMFGPHRPNLESDPSIVYLGDPNPLFVRPDRARLVPVRPVNSFAHGGGRGQNVVRLGGSAAWVRTPRCGSCGDDIYRAGNRNTYQGTEGPESATDSFLTP